MKDFKKLKGSIKTYDSFEELGKDEKLRKQFGLKPIKRRTNDKDKLKAQQEKFTGKCRVCGQYLVWIDGTNTLACKNTDCNGIRMSSKNEDGTEKVWYIPVTRTLDEKGMQIAERLFSE